jgi:hypothetical protein
MCWFFCTYIVLLRVAITCGKLREECYKDKDRLVTIPAYVINTDFFPYEAAFLRKRKKIVFHFHVVSVHLT